MNAEEFLSKADFFSLGHLPTEGFHPQTAHLLSSDLPKALGILQSIDQAAYKIITTKMDEIRSLATAIHSTIEAGNRVFLAGCGATGRLSLSLERLWRICHPEKTESIVAFMAGGDYALVKSIENFEDFPEMGARTLQDLKFREKDLMIAITEGGETPFVIGALLEATRISKKNHYFVYCNPKELLVETVARSKEAILHPQVISLELCVGPMALSGSTRLQAASVQLLAVGMALFHLPASAIHPLITSSDSTEEIETLCEWIRLESAAYHKNDFVLYETASFPIIVLTDTTERSPTFSLTSFEKLNDISPPFSWCYLEIPDAMDSYNAWKKILARAPRGLEWKEFNGRYSQNEILNFDFSRKIKESRARRLRPHFQNVISIEQTSESDVTLRWNYALIGKLLLHANAHPLIHELQMKNWLNRISLLVMSSLRRVDGNIMIYVRPSNGKLMDRALRYTQFLLEKNLQKKGATLAAQIPSNAIIVRTLIKNLTKLSPDQPVVLATVKELSL